MQRGDPYVSFALMGLSIDANVSTVLQSEVESQMTGTTRAEVFVDVETVQMVDAPSSSSQYSSSQYGRPSTSSQYGRGRAPSIKFQQPPSLQIVRPSSHQTGGSYSSTLGQGISAEHEERSFSATTPPSQDEHDISVPLSSKDMTEVSWQLEEDVRARV
jgi:hypothetical protein